MATKRAGKIIKWVLILLVLGGLVGGGIYYYKQSQDTGTEYQTAQVTRGELVQAVTATGQLNPVVNVQVGSQISGRIQKIYVDYNATVKSNQVIAEIDPSTYKVAVMRAEAELANAKANLRLAELNAERAQSLFTNNLIPAADHDTAVAQAAQANAQVQSAQAAVENARVDLSRCTIQAPVDGVVISRNVDVGQTVAASFNTPTLFLIANDLTKMQIDALVSEADIGGVAVGQNVNFNVDAYPYRTFRGTVSQVRYGAITNQNVVNYDCVIEVSNPDQKLLPGMTANISIVTAERENALKVPNAALRFRPPELAEARTNTAPRAMAQAGNAAGKEPGGPGGRAGIAQGGGGPGIGASGGAGGGPGGERGPGMRRERGSGGEGAGAPGGMGQGGRNRQDRQTVRTVYMLEGGSRNQGQKQAPKLKPVQVKVGITDGISTEVIEGIEEGGEVVTGVIVSAETRQGSTPNPFGGGMRRF